MEVGFEGAEKKVSRHNPPAPHRRIREVWHVQIELDFVQMTDGQRPPIHAGLRVLPKAFWDKVVSVVGASIIEHHAGRSSHLDSYLLSESSLFVYADKIVMLTALRMVLDRARDELKLRATWFQYSRKNFQFPQHQPSPHSSFEEEVDLLLQSFPHGISHALGPLNRDHWYLFMHDAIERDEVGEPVDVDQLLNVFMYDLPRDVAAWFENSEHSPSALELAEKTGMSRICDHARVTHARLFTPCGYSVNGSVPATHESGEEAYWTIHVTPEDGFSYASFETNLRCTSYAEAIRRVVQIFRPGRWQAVEHVDQHSVLGRAGKLVPTVVAGYCLRNRSINQFEPGYVVQMTSFVETAAPGPVPPNPFVFSA